MQDLKFSDKKKEVDQFLGSVMKDTRPTKNLSMPIAMPAVTAKLWLHHSFSRGVRIFLLSCVAMVLGMHFLVLPLQAQLEPRNREVFLLENRLNSQLENYLANILPANAFAVSTTIRTALREVGSQSPAGSDLPQDEALGDLPGLEGVGTDNSISSATPTTRTEIDAVDVQITLDNDVPRDTQEAIRRAVASKLDALYQGAAVFNLSTADLQSDLDPVADVNSVTPFNPTNVEVQESVLDRYSIVFYSLLALMGMLLLALLLFIFLWFLFRLLNRREQRRRYEVMHGISGNNEDTPFDDLKSPPKRPLPPQPPVVPISRLSGSTEKHKFPTPHSFPAASAIGSTSFDNQTAGSTGVGLDERNGQEKNLETDSQASTSLLKAEGRFVKNLLEDPLSARKFFMEMEREQKVALLDSFSSESFKKHFLKLDPSLKTVIDRLQAEAAQDERDQDTQADNRKTTTFEKVKTLDMAVQSLKQYRDLLQYQINDPIGRLSLLSPEEITVVFSSLPSSTLVSLAPFIEASIMNKYVRGISEAKKRELLAEISDSAKSPPKEDDDFEISDLDLSDIDLNKLDADERTDKKLQTMKSRLNSQIDELAKNIFIDRASKDTIIETIFKDSTNTKQLLEEIKEKDEELFQRFQRFGIGFEDALSDADSPTFRRLVEDSSNNRLATIMIGLGPLDQNKILGLLPEARRDLVNSLMFNLQGSIGRNEVTNERDSFLQAYRNMKI